MAEDEPTNDEVEEQEEQETSLREDLLNAIEEEETEDEAEEETEDETEEEETEEKEKPESSGTLGDAEGDSTPGGINAPIGFSPEAREQWEKVPEVVKEQIAKREKEITEAVANTGEYRRTHTALNELAQSYAPILAAEGAETPMAAVEGLFRTVAELRVGTPEQTAQRMADLIGHYNIDIGMLDKALSGQPVVTPEQNALEQMLDQKLAPLQGMFNQLQEQQTTQQAQAANAVNEELAEFAKNAEFLNDVRHDMADLIELASRQGRIMSFEDAYNKACAMHPEVSKVLADRQAAEQLTSQQQKASEKAAASAAIPSNSANVQENPSDTSLRGTISSIWDQYTE